VIMSVRFVLLMPLLAVAGPGGGFDPKGASS
jgi:hypothetical protein